MNQKKEKERIRLLMLAKKKITHKLAEYKNDELRCKICKIVVQPASWDVHLKSEDHLGKVKRLREENEEQQQEPNAKQIKVEENVQKKEPLAEPMVVIEEKPHSFVNVENEMSKFASGLLKQVVRNDLKEENDEIDIQDEEIVEDKFEKEEKEEILNNMHEVTSKLNYYYFFKFFFFFLGYS